MQAGLVQSCHDLSEGGLAVALQKCVLAAAWARLWTFRPQLGAVFSHPYVPLFSETNGRLLLEVAPTDRAALEEILSDVPVALIGEVTEANRLAWARNGEPVFNISIEEILSAWKEAEAD